MPLAATQIVWLKLDCPHDGSRGELCYRFFKAVDDAVGSEFFDQYKRSRITIDSMLTLMQRIAQMLDAVYEETQGIIVLAVVLYMLLQEDAIRSERETFDVEDIRRVARERMALVQPMLKALRDDNKKEIDRYEDITEILVGEVTSEIRDGQPFCS